MLSSTLRTSLLLFFSTLLFWQSAPAAVDAANLLLISPSLSKSLLMHMGKLADILVGAGHNVTVWIPEMQPLAENGTKLAQQVIRTRGLINVVDCIVGLDAFAEEIGDYGARLVEDQAMASYCEALLERGTELERLRAAHFDLAFSNMIDLCFHGIVHQLGIPRHIWVSTGPIPDAFHWFLGVPQPPSIVPNLQETLPLGPRMTAWERAQNMWQMALSWYSLGVLFRRENALFRERFSPDFPPLEQLAVHHTDLAFVNVDEFLEPALPTLRKVIPTGGLGLMEPRRHLSPEFAKVVQSGPKGAVLFSLGSMTDTRLLDAKKWTNLLRAFAHFADYAFIVKTSPDDWIARNFSVQNEARNVHLFEWLPQIELLAHPNVRLLIGHAGYNSLLEASALGVPVLLIPLFFDQLRNAKCAEYRGHARVLSKSDLLVEEKLVAEIGEMLENQSYKQKALRLAKLFREKPNRPEQAVIEWTQFVLSNGPLEEMVPESAGMSLVQFHCLDILLYAGVLIAMLSWLLYKTIRISIGWWRRGGGEGKKRKRD